MSLIDWLQKCHSLIKRSRVTEGDTNEIFHLFGPLFCSPFSCIYQPHFPNLFKGLSSCDLRSAFGNLGLKRDLPFSL